MLSARMKPFHSAHTSLSTYRKDPLMRHTLNLAFLEPENYIPAAKAAEEAGFDTIALSDSVFFPRDTSVKYPYNDDGGRSHFEDKPLLDAFTVIPAMAAVTERLSFVPCVLKLPIREPVIVAKLASSVAVLTGNRFKMGVGTSPFPEDYEVLGVPWGGRGKRMDECIAVIRGITAGGYFEFHGESYDFPPIKMCPIPTAKIPILVGGHSNPALRRAADIGDGWIAPATGVSYEALAEMLAVIRAELAEHDRVGDFEVHASLDVTADTTAAEALAGLDKLAAVGVTDARVAFRKRPYQPNAQQQLRDLLDDIQSFADGVLSATV